MLEVVYAKLMTEQVKSSCEKSHLCAEELCSCKMPNERYVSVVSVSIRGLEFREAMKFLWVCVVVFISRGDAERFVLTDPSSQNLKYCKAYTQL